MLQSRICQLSRYIYETNNGHKIKLCLNSQHTTLLSPPTPCQFLGGWTLIFGSIFLSDVDECSSNAHNCSPDAECTNQKGTFLCTCKRGYNGNGHNCSGKFRTKATSSGDCIACLCVSVAACNCVHQEAQYSLCIAKATGSLEQLDMCA